MISYRSRTVISTNAEMTEEDWKIIFSHNWSEEYRLALEAIRQNGNKPTSVELFRKRAPAFHVRRRERINDILRRKSLPFFVVNVYNYSEIGNASLQVVHRSPLEQ